MKFINLTLDCTDQLLNLEGEMYWQGAKWRNLWEREAKEKFRGFIEDYLTNFPKGCFGLIDDRGELLGAMILIKISGFKPIPYLHKFSDYLEENGEIAYVSFFVVKKASNEEEVANKLYDHAEEVALTKIGCKNMAVVIYSSPLEERVLKGHNYERLGEQFEWEIYPSIKVPVWIYHYDLLFEESR